MEEVLTPLLPCAIEAPVEAAPEPRVGLGVQGHGVLELAVDGGAFGD